MKRPAAAYGQEMRRGAWIPVVLMAAGCGSTVHVTPGTALTIRATNANVGQAVFHLRCAPPRGDLADNAAACAAIRSAPELVTSPKPFNCYGGTTSWWDITIAGRLAGERLYHAVSTCWTPQMEMIRRLGLDRGATLESHLLPRRKAIVYAESERTFAPGALRPGDAVVCNIRGHALEFGVPVPSSTPPGSVGYSGAHIIPVTLELDRKRDGSLVARCGDGDQRPDLLAFQ